MSQPPASPVVATVPYRDDEIDLAELGAKLWGRKWWVLIAAVLAGLAAGGYLLVVKPVYRAQLYLMPPTTADLSGVNVRVLQADGGVLLDHAVTPAQAYGLFLNELQSKNRQWAFFQRPEMAAVYRSSDEQSELQAFEAFRGSLAVNLPKTGEVVFTSLTLEGGNADTVAQQANDYLGDVGRATAQLLVQEVISERDRKIDTLAKAIATKRQLAEQRRLDRIRELEEALVIAEAVGLKQLGLASATVDRQQHIYSDNRPLFMRGSDALQAEVEVLKARKSDDAFIAGLRGLQEAISNLESVRPDLSQLNVTRVDFQAVAPEKPLRPKKRLILAGALVFGLMLGGLVALVVPARSEGEVQSA